MKIIPPDFFRPKMAKLEGRVYDDALPGERNLLTEGEIFLEPIYASKGIRTNGDEYALMNEETKCPYYLYRKGDGGPFADWNMPPILLLKDSGHMWFIAEEGDPTNHTVGELQGKIHEAE
jgi:hypothetical protein